MELSISFKKKKASYKNGKLIEVYDFVKANKCLIEMEHIGEDANGGGTTGSSLEL